MLNLNPMLQALLEATETDKNEKKKDKDKENSTKNAMIDVTKEGSDDIPDPPEDAESENSNTDNNREGETDNEKTGSETVDTQKTDKGSETETSEEESQDDESGTDFTLDDENDNEEDLPDGLTDPDDDGSDDDSGENEETNLHINILNISKIERALAKKRCLQDFMDLRSSVDSLNNMILSYEATIDPNIRCDTIKELNKMYTSISDYLKYKFSYTNYEENLQNYLIFVHSVNAIAQKLHEKGISDK